jgi:C4-dicarboxylate-specific signal transduction histidine kinase
MAGEIRNKSTQSRFVSLHRKWLASLSLLLFVISAAFGTLNYLYLEDQVRTQQAANQAAWQAEFKGLIEHSIDRLQRLSIVLASLGNLTGRLDKLNSSITKAELEEQFSSVRYELDVERIMVFDKDGKIRWNWSAASSSSGSMQLMIDTISRRKNTEQPEAVHCVQQGGEE